jgi:DNA-binding GntR family transcriptional regulator
VNRLVEKAIVIRTATTYTKENLMRSNSHHAEMARAIESGNGLLAESIMRTHIYLAMEVVKPKNK